MRQLLLHRCMTGSVNRTLQASVLRCIQKGKPQDKTSRICILYNTVPVITCHIYSPYLKIFFALSAAHLVTPVYNRNTRTVKINSLKQSGYYVYHLIQQSEATCFDSTVYLRMSCNSQNKHLLIPCT